MRRDRRARAMALARLAEHLEHLTRAYVLPAIAYAEEMARRGTLSPAVRVQIHEMIALAQETARVFCSPPRCQSQPRLERAAQRFAAVLLNLSAWDDDLTAQQFWAEAILGSQQDWLHLTEVATVPLLEGKAGWTRAERPLPYLAQATRMHRLTEEQTYAPRTGEVPLDEETCPIACNPAPSEDHYEELIAAVLKDADAEVKEYGALFLAGSTHDEIRRQLGWYKKRAQRVAVRYRRHLKHAAHNRDVQQCRQMLANGLANASRTVRKVYFRDDEEGRRYGYFEHLESWKNRPEI